MLNADPAEVRPGLRTPWNAVAHSTSMPNLKANFASIGQPATEKADARFPNGVALDVSEPAGPSCSAVLAYPADSIGVWFLECSICGLRCGVTAAGRPDDPRFVRVACKLAGAA